MNRKYRVHLIGSGYESIKFYILSAPTPHIALAHAADLAEKDDYILGIDFLEMECECI